MKWISFSMLVICGKTERSNLMHMRSKGSHLYLCVLCWNSRIYRFRHLKLRTGEIIIDKIDSVEDTKGNNGVAGTLDYAVNCLLLYYA